MARKRNCIASIRPLVVEYLDASFFLFPRSNACLFHFMRCVCMLIRLCAPPIYNLFSLLSAAYFCKVQNWRAGVETDIAEVLQSEFVFFNVGKVCNGLLVMGKKQTYLG